MKKIIITYFTIFLFVGCSKNSDNSEFNPNDIDGDGVTNQQEVVDGTNPEDICDYNLGSQYYPSVSNKWKSLDCDGDGVTNGDEVDPDGNGTKENNGTLPFLFCDVNISYQTLTPSDEFLNYDCDGDGFSNRKEILNNTNINDACDFKTVNQDLQPLSWWLNYDCDNDGRTNEQEINHGSNPLDANDFFGSGDKLTKIIEIGRKTHIFTESGMKYNKVLSTDGSVIADFVYDFQNNLISVSMPNAFISFEYENDKIVKVTKTVESVSTVTDVVYEGDTIYTYDGTEPVGRYSKKYTFDPINGKILMINHLFNDKGNTYLNSKSYSYDDNYNNLLNTLEKSYEFNNITGEIIPPPYPNQNEGFVIYYRYADTVKSPIYEATKKLYINFLLEPKILENGWLFGMGSESSFCKNHLLEYGFYTTYVSHVFQFGISNVQSNGFPIKSYHSDFGVHYDYDFFYE